MKCQTCCGIGFIGRGQKRRFCPECDTGESAVPTMTKEEIKEAVKEALKEYDDEKNAGKWIADPSLSQYRDCVGGFGGDKEKPKKKGKK